MLVTGVLASIILSCGLVAAQDPPAMVDMRSYINQEFLTFQQAQDADNTALNEATGDLVGAARTFVESTLQRGITANEDLTGYLMLYETLDAQASNQTVAPYFQKVAKGWRNLISATQDPDILAVVRDTKDLSNVMLNSLYDDARLARLDDSTIEELKTVLSELHELQ